jgi:hypothetical protein
MTKLVVFSMNFINCSVELSFFKPIQKTVKNKNEHKVIERKNTTCLLQSSQMMRRRKQVKYIYSPFTLLCKII